MVMHYVKSPVASLCLACSSVRNLVRVMMSVLTCSVEVRASGAPFVPFAAMFAMPRRLYQCLMDTRCQELMSRNSLGRSEGRVRKEWQELVM